jgi:hypothetical protein
MKNFLAIYTGSENAMKEWEKLDSATRQEKEQAGMKAWQKWAETNSKSIVEMGSPVGKTKRISKTGISDIKNNIAAFTIVRAESHEAAAKLFTDHPHFSIFPGDSVEIMPCLPIPGSSEKN